jgi:post-segregation antitoxin (ccd killing protein)
MPKMQVYLPDPLYAQVKAQGARLNVSAILQDALEERLAALARLDALAAAIERHETESGPFTQAELDRQADADRDAVVSPRTKKRPAVA